MRFYLPLLVCHIVACGLTQTISTRDIVPEGEYETYQEQTEDYFEIIHGLEKGWSDGLVVERVDDFSECTDQVGYFDGCTLPEQKRIFLSKNLTKPFQAAFKHELCHIGIYAKTWDADFNHEFKDCYHIFAMDEDPTDGDIPPGREQTLHVEISWESENPTDIDLIGRTGEFTVSRNNPATLWCTHSGNKVSFANLRVSESFRCTKRYGEWSIEIVHRGNPTNENDPAPTNIPFFIRIETQYGSLFHINDYGHRALSNRERYIESFMFYGP